MSSLPPEPTRGEIDLLRTSALDRVTSDDLTCDPGDLERVRSDDRYLRRFLMHHDNDLKLSLDMVMDTLKWRWENKCNEITKESLPPSFFTKASMFTHNRDKNGCKMLLFIVKEHSKGVHDMEHLKKFFIYWLERLEREENGEWITVFFDMTDTGMKNMDMELIQYMINLFKNYYPWILNYIIVFEMPWLLSAMWKIIKTWLPPKSIEKIKFVDKKSLKEFVSSDQALKGWGGSDDYEYQFEAELVKAEVVTNNGDLDGKKVHFADGSVLPIPPSPVRPKPQLRGPNGEVVVEIEPSEELVFSNCNVGTTATILLSNPTSTILAFKIKTTSPEKYRVRPSVGVLESGGGKVEVGVSVGDTLTTATLVRDKFLVMVTPINNTTTNSTQDVSLLFKTVNKDDIFESRLRVGVSSALTENNNNNNNDNDNINSLSNINQSSSPQIMSKLDEILNRQLIFEEKLKSTRRLILLLLLLMVIIVILLIVVSNYMTTSLLLYSTSVIQQQQQQQQQQQHGEL